MFFLRTNRNNGVKKIILFLAILVFTSIYTDAQVSKNAWVTGAGISMPKVALTWENYGMYLSLQKNFTEHAGLRLSANFNSITRKFGLNDVEQTKTASFWSSLDLIYSFLPCISFAPYAFTGVGVNTFSHDNAQHDPGEGEAKTVFQAVLGFGSEVRLNEELNLKIEVGSYLPFTDYYDGRYGSNGGGIWGTNYDSFIKADIGVLWYFSKGETSRICQTYDGIKQEDGFDYEKFEKSLEKNIQKDVVKEKAIIKTESVEKEKMLLLGVGFEFNSSQLTAESYPILYHVSQTLKENSNLKIEIEGHCDNLGTEIINKKISLDRAKAVKEYVVERGIQEEKISGVGYGASQPIADNSTEKGRALNRRIEFRIIE